MSARYFLANHSEFIDLARGIELGLVLAWSRHCLIWMRARVRRVFALVQRAVPAVRVWVVLRYPFVRLLAVEHA